MTDENIHEVSDVLEPVDGEGLPWGVIGAALVTALLIVFIFQNFESVTVEFLWFDFELPVALLIGATAAITIVITLVISARRRKRKRAAQAPSAM